jgi:DNA-binding CsgD family transcriptional regulator
MNNSETCLFILDGDLNLIFSSRTAGSCDCGHDALIFQDNRLTGIFGLRSDKFRSSFFSGNVVKRTILLRVTGKNDEGSRLLLKITPLFNSTAPSPDINGRSVCLEIQSIDIFHSTTVKKVAKKYNLTKAETLVMQCLIMGLSSDEIEKKLMIGKPTLRTHKQRLRQKTGETSSIRTVLCALNPENHADDLIEIENLSSPHHKKKDCGIRQRDTGGRVDESNMKNPHQPLLAFGIHS